MKDIFNLLLTAQLEEVLDPYLADTNIGLPYWDWNHDSTVPDLFDNIYLPIKDFTHEDYSWEQWKGWDPEMLSVCQNPDPTQHQRSDFSIKLTDSFESCVTIMCLNDELNSTMS